MNYLTPEMRAALNQMDGGPIEFQDAETKRVYVLIEAGAPITLADEYVRGQVEMGLDAIDRGEVADWDAADIKSEGRKLLSDSTE